MDANVRFCASLGPFLGWKENEELWIWPQKSELRFPDRVLVFISGILDLSKFLTPSDEDENVAGNDEHVTGSDEHVTGYGKNLTGNDRLLTGSDEKNQRIYDSVENLGPML